MASKKEITTEISWAIRRAIDTAGTEKRLATQAGINRTTLNQISCGKVDAVTAATWERLYPHIAPYLPGEPAPTVVGGIRVTQGAGGISVIGSGNRISAPQTDGTLPITDRLIETDLFSAEEKIYLISLIRADEKRRRARRPNRAGIQPEEE